MKLFDYKEYEVTIKFINPINYIGDYMARPKWKYLGYWLCYHFKENVCDIWFDIGFRALGIQLMIRKYLPIKPLWEKENKNVKKYHKI